VSLSFLCIVFWMYRCHSLGSMVRVRVRVRFKVRVRAKG
jgi:hypothetical protein